MKLVDKEFVFLIFNTFSLSLLHTFSLNMPFHTTPLSTEMMRDGAGRHALKRDGVSIDTAQKINFPLTLCSAAEACALLGPGWWLVGW